MKENAGLCLMVGVEAVLLSVLFVCELCPWTPLWYEFTAAPIVLSGVLYVPGPGTSFASLFTFLQGKHIFVG